MIAALLGVLLPRAGPRCSAADDRDHGVLRLLLGLSSIALPSLLADIVDYDVWRNRRDRAAILFSFQAVVTKLNQGVGGAVALAIPTLFGFDARQEITASAALGLKVAFVAWPCLLLLPMLALAWRYPLGQGARYPCAASFERRPEKQA